MRLSKTFAAVCVALALAAPCAPALADEAGYRFSENLGVKEVAPGPKVKVKLKHLADGSYTWEISGSDVQKVIEADRAIRAYISKEGLKAK